MTPNREYQREKKKRYNGEGNLERQILWGTRDDLLFPGKRNCQSHCSIRMAIHYPLILQGVLQNSASEQSEAELRFEGR